MDDGKREKARRAMQEMAECTRLREANSAGDTFPAARMIDALAEARAEIQRLTAALEHEIGRAHV